MGLRSLSCWGGWRWKMEIICNNNCEGDVVVLRLSGDHCAEVRLWGATLTSWKQRGEEKLFLSDTAVFDGKKAIRGGIPLVFPQFAQPDSSMPQHGFARIKTWSLLHSSAKAGSVSAWFSLQSDDETLAQWPHKFVLVYEVILTESSLTTSLHITNPSEEAFGCQSLLHTYLRVSSIHDVAVEGFAGCTYVDKVRGGEIGMEDRQAISVDQEIDRVYYRAEGAGPVLLRSKVGGADLMQLDCSAEVRALGCASSQDPAAVARFCAEVPSSQRLAVDRVLWNAWVERCRAIADLQDSAYLHYVCVEPGLVSEPLTVEAHHCVTLRQELRSLA